MKVLFLHLLLPHSRLKYPYVVELGLVIGTPGRDISQEHALDHVAGYGQSSSPFSKFKSSHALPALAVDMTARNVQDVAKAKGLPWSAAKGMDTFTPVG